MAPGKRRRAATLRALAAAGACTLCALVLVVAARHGPDGPLRARAVGGAQSLSASSGMLTVTAPSRETVHTTVSHSLGSVPVAVLLGLDLPGFDYYEFTDDQCDSSGTPADVPVHLSALVRKPYNGTFTVRLKHYLGGQRSFTVRWLAIKLER